MEDEAGYSFPLMQPNEIFEHLHRSLEIEDITNNDILKPRQITLSKLYARLVWLWLNMPYEAIFELDESTLENLRDSSTAEESLLSIKVFNKTKEILDSIGCPNEFQLVDLTRPDFRKTKRYLSAFINFLKFCEEESQMIGNDTEDIPVGYEYTQQIETEIKEMQSQVNFLQKEVDEQAPLVAKHQERQAILDEELKKLREEESTLKKAISKAESDREDIVSKDEAAKAATPDLEAQIQKLKDEIVLDPDPIIEAHGKAKLDAEEAENKLNTKTSYVFEIGEQANTIYQIVEQFEKLRAYHDDSVNPVQQALAGVKQKLAGLKHDSEELRKQIDYKKFSLNQQLTGTNLNNDEKNRLKEHLDKITYDQNDASSKKTKNIEEKRKIVENLISMLQEKKTETEQLDTEIREVQREKQSSLRKIDEAHQMLLKELTAYLENYESLREKYGI